MVIAYNYRPISFITRSAEVISLKNDILAVILQWRNQSPSETRATAQYKTNHNYDNNIVDSNWHLSYLVGLEVTFINSRVAVGNYSNIITILVKTRRKR